MAEPAAAPVPRAAAEPALRRELWAWSALAVGALAVAGAFALLLALSRVPGVESVFPWPIDFFEKGLVIHVVFSFVVWFLAVFGALLTRETALVSGGAPRFAALGAAGAAAVALAAPMLFVPALLDRGEATLNNYVPVIIDPLYYAGLVVLGLGIALPAVRFLLNRAAAARPARAESRLLAGGAAVYLLALLCFAIAAGLNAGVAPSHAFNEELFWGGGHVLQILNTLLLLVAWIALARIAMPGWTPAGAIVGAVLVILVGAAIAGPLFYALFVPFSAAQTGAFTDLQYALGPPVLLLAAALALGRREHGLRRTPAMRCIALSALVFLVGAALGLFVDGADTRTPAHYHGVIAGVTLAFMGVFYDVLLPAQGRAVAPGMRRSLTIYLFGFGQLTASIGLFLAGGFGAPRKTAGSAQGLEDWGAIVGMAMNGVGALIAVAGGILFIWIVAAALIGGSAARGTTMARPSPPA